MERSKKDRAHDQMNPGKVSPMFFGGRKKTLWVLLLAGLILSGCGGGSSSSSSQNSGPLAGNWQFTLASPSDGSFVGTPSMSCPTPPGMPTPVCSGGFLQQNKGSVTGGVVYSIALPPVSGGLPTVCNSGSAPVTGTISGQTVILTAVAGTQTFTLNGTLSANGSTMMGTYSSSDGKGCGTAQTGLQWSATSVPPLSGTIQGSFHSTSGPLSNQDFPVSGTLTQGDNIGASNATVTGTLNFQGYPCMDTAAVNGQISGNSVILQIFESNGLNAGQIGAPVGAPNLSPVVFVNSAPGGGVLRGTNGYGLSTKVCPAQTNSPGDLGNICLALGNTTSCTQPISLSPASLTFPPQGVGSAPTTQTITLTNTDPSGTTLNPLSFKFDSPGGLGSPFGGCSDFNGVPNFKESNTCGAAQTQSCETSVGPFSLGPQKSCSITISFSPQQSCPWLPLTPQNQGEPPALCPFPLAAKLSVTSPKTKNESGEDSDANFVVPITGIGLSALATSTPELDFGSEAVSEKSLPQGLSFTNQGTLPVQVLPALNQPCVNPTKGQHILLPRPLVPGTVDGLHVVTGDFMPVMPQQGQGSTIGYICDSDPTNNEPNFQISADSCSGRVLAPQGKCSLEVSFVPQPGTAFTPPLDYFLELDTLQCTDSTTSHCEIDSGRFPVELTANVPSPLRMSPGAGLDFGTWPMGQLSDPLTITLFNDPKDPNSQTITFTGNLVKGDFAETDDCGTSLAPGGSCTLTITFTPKIVGFDQGTITITYTVGQTQTVYLRGIGQQVF
jgi:hypothetical protein